MKVKIFTFIMILMIGGYALSFYLPTNEVTININEINETLMRQELLLRIMRQMELLLRIIGIIAPPEIFKVIEPIIKDIEELNREIVRGLIPRAPTKDQNKDERKEGSRIAVPPDLDEPGGEPYGEVTIAVVDMFSYGNHGEMVIQALMDSLPPGFRDRVKIVKIDLCKYRVWDINTQPREVKPGVVQYVRDGIIYVNGEPVGVVITGEGLIRALEEARGRGADIINMSNGTNEPLGFAFDDLIRKFEEEGIIIVAAGGNDGRYGASYPALYSDMYDNVIGVGAFGSYSNHGPGITVIADGNYEGHMGTSFSAPKVSAAVAMLLLGGVQPLEVKDELLRLCEELTGGNYLPDTYLFASALEWSPGLIPASPNESPSRFGSDIGKGGAWW